MRKEIVYRLLLLLLFFSVYSLPDLSYASPICDSCQMQVQTLDKPFSLRGNWLFTRDDRPENAQPGIDLKSWALVRTPGPWKGAYGDGKVFEVGWYRGKIHFAPHLIGQEAVLLLDAYMGGVQFFIDGELRYQRDQGSALTKYYSIQPIPIRFRITQPTHTVAFRIDTYLMTGVYQWPFEIRGWNEHDNQLAMIHLWNGEIRIVAGYVCFFAGIFFLLIYLKTRFRLYLWAAMAGMVFFPFLGFPNDTFIHFFPPKELFLLHYIGLSTAFFHFLFSQYFYRSQPRLNRVIGIILLAFCLIFVGFAIFGIHLGLFQKVRAVFLLLALSMSVGMAYQVIRGVMEKKPGARILFPGVLFYMVAAVHDLLLALGVIYSISLLFTAALTITISILWVAGNIFANTFIENRTLLKDLKVMNDTLEDLVDERTHELTKKKSEVEAILLSLVEGVFTFGQDYRIGPEYSKACTQFFEGPIEGKNPVDLLFPEAGGGLRDRVKEAMDLIFEDPSRLTVVEELLPKETLIGNNTYTLHYTLLKKTEENSAQQIMVTLADVTNEKRMKAQIKAEEDRNEMIIKVALDRNGFVEFLHELEGLFHELSVKLESPPKTIEINALFRTYHTIKGGTASYGLRRVSEQAHHVEEILDETRKSGAAITPEKLDQLREETAQLRELFKSSLEQLSGIISSEERQRRERVYHVPNSKIIHLKQFIGSRLSGADWSIIQTAIESLKRQPIAPIFRKFGAAAEGLAERLGKKVQIVFKGTNIEIPHDELEGLFSAMIHVVRNAIDHGLEDPATRVMLGKPESGKLTLIAEEQEEAILLSIIDDGAGIDTERVGQIAVTKGIVTQAQLENMSEAAIRKLIFAPGFSTKEEVTAVSGRGVGMDAVNASVLRLQGELEVESTLDEGTTVRIRIPLPNRPNQAPGVEPAPRKA